MVDLGRARLPPQWSRRELVGGVVAGTVVATRAFAQPAAVPHAATTPHPSEPGHTPGAALQRLKDGNARFVGRNPRHPDQSVARRISVASGQRPFATILTCADSRVSPEIIFDQGLGSLFVIRVAGNVVDDVVLGSMEYSVIHLGVPLIMVLGHEGCGAVAAAVQAVAGHSDKEDGGTKIGALAGLIVPAVKAVPANAPNKTEAAVLLNARHSAHQVMTFSNRVRDQVGKGRLRVVSAVYSLHSGRVSDFQAAEV